MTLGSARGSMELGSDGRSGLGEEGGELLV